MKQNKYDDASFFDRYSRMTRSVEGLEGAGEWAAFRSLLPNLAGKRVLDLGCGFGWHCRYVREQGARAVIGVDLSAKMLARAGGEAHDPSLRYERCAIEDARFENGQFDLVLSSLALHYVERFDAVCRKVFDWLATGGAFVFSVEHPVFTALAAQEWCTGAAGERLHWPVDDYQKEGIRHTSWMAEDVVKYHRTLASYVNSLIDSGFRITRLEEPTVTEDVLTRRPEWRDESRRPMFLIISAVRSDKR